MRKPATAMAFGRAMTAACAVLATCGGLLAPATPARAQTIGPAITIVEPFGLNSPSETAIRLLRPALERELGAKLLIEHLGGANGDVALARVVTAPPNGRTLLVITDASRIFHEYLAKPAHRLSELRPIAKLTDGISLALVVPVESPLASWEQFAAAGPNPPAVAAFGRDSPSGVFLNMIDRHLGRELPVRRFSLDVDVINAMAQGGGAGVLETSTALAMAAGGRRALRVLLTSGARRHPSLPDTPTLAEITGKARQAFTLSVGVFGPPNLPDEAVATLARAFLAAGRDEAVHAQALRQSLPLAVRDAGVLRDTIARTGRVIRELAGR